MILPTAPLCAEHGLGLFELWLNKWLKRATPREMMMKCLVEDQEMVVFLQLPEFEEFPGSFSQ